MSLISASVSGDLVDQERLRRILGHDRLLFVLGAFFAPREELGEIGHDIAALGLGRLMAALALRLEDGADLFVVADRSVGVLHFHFLWRHRAKGGNRQGGEEQKGRGGAAAEMPEIHVLNGVRGKVR